MLRLDRRGRWRRIDTESWAIRVTPRRKGSNWSAININAVAELTAAGRMRPAGLAAFAKRDRRKDAIYSYERPPAEMPPEMLARLQADTRAWAFWEARASVLPQADLLVGHLRQAAGDQRAAVRSSCS